MSSEAQPGQQPIQQSEERYARTREGLDICFQTFGDPAGKPLLLVMGLGGPMTWWPVDLCRRLAAEGYFVIRYDNRDTGRSTRMTAHRITRGHLMQAFLGGRVFVPYTLSDMAEDGLAVLDDLGIDRAHVAGVSMGGMIVQTMTIDHPERVLSLTSIMSSTGSRRAGWQDPKLLPFLLARAGNSRQEYIDGSVRFWRRISSPGFRDTDAAARARAAETWDRGISLSGVMRQMVAILAQPDRTKALQDVRIPASVVHGLDDRMVHSSGGRATARAIPGAHLTLVPGMGHDIPPGLFPTLVDAINRAAQRAEDR